MDHVFVGFGFGPIQAGLFAKEARDSGRFSECVVAEIDPLLVAAVRGKGNRYTLNVACSDRIEAVTIEGVTLLNPSQADDLRRLRDGLSRATEIVTSLPSVDFFTRGGETSVARLMGEGLRGSGAAGTVIYTAENNNHAAEILERDVAKVSAGGGRPAHYLNTVIGKMSQVISDPAEIEKRGLTPIVPGFPRAFLVEAFNRILVSRILLPGFTPGISAFEEKDDLLPFEEAKLYGHNAAHTMLGFLGALSGTDLLSDLRNRSDWMAALRTAFLEESGSALIARYGRLGDPLFTPDGFHLYVDDLLARMTNPYLGDTVARAIRDPLRKLGPSDRLFGAMRLCLAHGVEPEAWALGALAGLHALPAEHPSAGFLRRGQRMDGAGFERLLEKLWGEGCPAEERLKIAGLLERAQDRLIPLPKSS